MAASHDSDQHHDDQAGAASSLPTPVAAALGVVVSGVRTAKNLPTIAPQLPLIGMAFVAQKVQTVRREYLGYAARGVAFVQKMTGEAVTVGSQLTGLAGGLHKESSGTAGAERSIEEEAREVAEKARDAVEKATQLRRGATRSTGRPAGRMDAAAKPTGKRASGRPAGGRAAAAPAPPESPARPDASAETALPDEAIEAGAPGASTAAAEQAGEQAGAQVASTAADGEELSADELAIPDIDHLTLASLRARLRQLDVSQLVILRAYELAHANRLQVVTMLENRIAKLEAQGPKTDGDKRTDEPGRPGGESTAEPGGQSTAEPGGQSAQDAAQQAAEPAMRQAEAGADDLGATPRP